MIHNGATLILELGGITTIFGPGAHATVVNEREILTIQESPPALFNFAAESGAGLNHAPATSPAVVDRWDSRSNDAPISGTDRH